MNLAKQRPHGAKYFCSAWKNFSKNENNANEHSVFVRSMMPFLTNTNAVSAVAKKGMSAVNSKCLLKNVFRGGR